MELVTAPNLGYVSYVVFGTKKGRSDHDCSAAAVSKTTGKEQRMEADAFGPEVGDHPGTVAQSAECDRTSC